MLHRIAVPDVGITLVGGGGKRRAYFEAACRDLGGPFDSIGYKELAENHVRIQGRAVKLDTPEYRETDVGKALGMIGGYIGILKKLESVDAFYLNPPQAILTALNKKECKALLTSAGVPVTDAVETGASGFDALRDSMKQAGIKRIFIKPVNGSGAAGVCALGFGGKNTDAVCYIPALCKDGALYNLKKIKRYEGGACRAVIDALLKFDCVVERWHKKPVYNGFYYDVRAVWQFGKIDSVAVRGSKGFITNLHLNDCLLPTAEVLNKRDMDAIEDILERVHRAMPRLNSFGADIITGETPRVVEINGQGDHLYGDIFNDNLIYKNQVKYLALTKKENSHDGYRKKRKSRDGSNKRDS